jgi:Cu(I)/Ag(I) efflux system membrane fusion protein
MNKLLIVLLLVLVFAAGTFFGPQFLPITDSIAVDDKPAPVYWVAPMDANYRRDAPGKSPMGMDLLPVYALADSDETLPGIRISPAVEHNLGVKTAVVDSRPMRSAINTVGFIQFDEDRLHHVHIRVDGWIESLNISAVGETVKRGELLFELYSPTLFNAQKDLVSALKLGEKSLTQSARQRLRLLGMNAKQIETVEKTRTAKERIGVYAHEAGIVSDLSVRHGMFIKPSSEVMAIGSIDTVWVIAEVFERQASWLATGRQVTMNVDSFPGEKWQTQVDYIYPVLNAKSRTIQVRMRVDNKDQRLKPNMFANLSIHSPAATSGVLSVPRTALIVRGRSQRVVKALGQGRYQSVAVIAGREVGDRVEILQGLNEGERVVVAGQFLIDSESNIEAESERMAVPDGMATTLEARQ